MLDFSSVKSVNQAVRGRGEGQQLGKENKEEEEEGHGD